MRMGGGGWLLYFLFALVDGQCTGSMDFVWVDVKYDGWLFVCLTTDTCQSDSGDAVAICMLCKGIGLHCNKNLQLLVR